MASPARSTSMLGGGGVCIAKHTFTHTCMHTYVHIYTHVDASVKWASVYKKPNISFEHERAK